MKNKQYSILFETVLMAALLFTACDNVVGPPVIIRPVDDGYGKISINCTGDTAHQDAARTVLPLTVFDKYVYTFTKTGGRIGVIKTPDDDGFFTLETGSYTVTVQAYIGAAEPYTLAASGVSSPFTVGPGTNAPVEVPLTAVTAGEGKFNYTITWPAGVTLEQITLQQWPNMNTITLSPDTVTAGNGITETLELGTGSYLLTVYISKTGFYAGTSEVIHIYPSLSTVYAKEFSDDDLFSTDMTVTNTAQWNAALMTIRNSGGGAANLKPYTITVSGDIPVSGSTNYSFGSVSNVSVTIRGSGRLYLTSTGNIIRTNSNQTVYIDSADLTLEGLTNGHNNSTINNNSSVVYIAGGTLELRDGKITGNTTSYNGGGVYVGGSGTFTMNGGEISGNTSFSSSSLTYGGGVYVDGTFTMSGGEISGNYTKSYGGGVYVGGTFTMSGGEISGNTASYGGDSGGGGVYVNGTFTMSGGKITGNTVSSSYSPYGGGVSVGGGTFTMSGGEISGNSGGGVYVGGGTFTMNGGEISGNTSFSGGGVYVGGGTFTKTGSGTIYGFTDGNAKSNVVKDSSGVVQNNCGYAVYVVSSLTNRRETTAGPGVNLDSNKIGAAGGWENNLGGLAAQLTWLQIYAASGTTYTYEVTADENLDFCALSYVGKTNVTILLKGDTVKRTVNLSGNGSLFSVSSGVTLILDKNLTLRGHADNSRSLVRVYSGGTLVMREGSVITGNTSSSSSGGVSVEDGTFTMSGGEISGNTSDSYGGGVYVGGTFTMSGGKISGNTASYGGGVSVGGTFTMSGGEISGNTSSYIGGGGGVYVYYGTTFTMSGGKITGNTASSSYGDGVYVDGTFTMSGGEISRNTPSYMVVVNSRGIFTKTGGGTIYGSYQSYPVLVVGSSKSRETTAGPGVNLDSRVDGTAGGWE